MRTTVTLGEVLEGISCCHVSYDNDFVIVGSQKVRRLACLAPPAWACKGGVRPLANGLAVARGTGWAGPAQAGATLHGMAWHEQYACLAACMSRACTHILQPCLCSDEQGCCAAPVSTARTSTHACMRARAQTCKCFKYRECMHLRAPAGQRVQLGHGHGRRGAHVRGGTQGPGAVCKRLQPAQLWPLRGVLRH